MIEFTISAAHNNARLAATIAFADAGANPSTIELFNASAALLARITLAKPCGAVANDALVLAQAAAGGDMIQADGVAVSAVWLSGTGVPVASGSVTDETGEGPFILEGTEGTQLYAGGRAILGVMEIA